MLLRWAVAHIFPLEGRLLREEPPLLILSFRRVEVADRRSELVLFVGQRFIRASESPFLVPFFFLLFATGRVPPLVPILGAHSRLTARTSRRGLNGRALLRVSARAIVSEPRPRTRPTSARGSMPRQRHRAKVKQRRLEAAAAASEDPHPLADPTRPIPNLACAFAFEHYYFRQNLVDPGREWWTFQNTRTSRCPSHSVCSPLDRSAMSAARASPSFSRSTRRSCRQ